MRTSDTWPATGRGRCEARDPNGAPSAGAPRALASLWRGPAWWTTGTRSKGAPLSSARRVPDGFRRVLKGFPRVPRIFQRGSRGFQRFSTVFQGSPMGFRRKEIFEFGQNSKTTKLYCPKGKKKTTYHRNNCIKGPFDIAWYRCSTLVEKIRFTTLQVSYNFVRVFIGYRPLF